ncbi:MAG: AbrB/MazE/SpoVT family DNA-binding domain-containing protein [Candidatus Hodarchaeales archaeon]|jgi:AbrB family looped-hinge helix DNA binding protein
MIDSIDIKERSFIRKRFTLVIPLKIRKKLELEEEEPVEITIKGNSIIITPIREDPYDKLTLYGKGVELTRKTKLEAEKMLKKMV